MKTAAATIAIPIPDRDFDPTEAAVPWQILTRRGHRVIFATPEAKVASADPIMCTGHGLGLLAGAMSANADGRAAYAALEHAAEFRQPISYAALRDAQIDALLLPGGHAKGMREYLESPILHELVATFIDSGKPTAAICHGVLLAARSRSARTGRAVIADRRVTALPRWMELLAWNLTRLWMGDYYRTYPEPLETEVRRLLHAPAQFQVGPHSLQRDSPHNLRSGFTVRDGNLLTARWPGDAHRFATEFAAMLESR